MSPRLKPKLPEIALHFEPTNSCAAAVKLQRLDTGNSEHVEHASLCLHSCVKSARDQEEVETLFV